MISLLSWQQALAETSYRELYIAITDAMISTKQGDEAQANEALATFERLWIEVETTHTDEKAAIDEALANVKEAETTDARITAFTELSKSMKALDNAENPVDEAKERADFGVKYRPFMQQFEQALATNDVQTVETAFKLLEAKWNKLEQPVRSQDVAMYGSIETQLAFMRIALSAEQVDVEQVKTQYELFKGYIEQFVAGETVQVEASETYSLQTLVDFIDRAEQLIDEEKFAQASEELTQFIIVWPNVEMEVSTRNGSLYSELESEMPILVSALMKQDVDAAEVKADLERLKVELQLLQEKTSYSFWDSALILLREGLEAILILMVLVTFLQKANQQRMVKWIYVGAGAGVVLSAVAAVMLSVLFQSLSANASREMLEGYIGLLAAAMMIGVGVWLHNKSTVASWNNYLSSRLNKAISTGSIVAMAAISFLSVFREGAETIIFYAGIAPNMETSEFVLGIVLALFVLALVAVVLVKVSGKIPVHKFFLVATVMIYVLAFKIIGTSIHGLQLTDVLPSTVLHSLPVVSTVGFYPTMETIVGQVVLLAIWIGTTVVSRKAHA